MKKSYHSTVVPITVAKTTRRRSVSERMLPVGVKGDVLIVVYSRGAATSLSGAALRFRQ